MSIPYSRNLTLKGVGRIAGRACVLARKVGRFCVCDPQKTLVVCSRWEYRLTPVGGHRAAATRCAAGPARTQIGLHTNTGGSMQDGIEVVASRLTVDGAELVAGTLLREIDL